MELREYWQMIRRRWWLPVALTALVALFSALQLRPWQAPPPSYSATMRLLVGVMPAGDLDTSLYDPRYYAWLTSEYLVDDFTEVVRSELFARQVSARLAQQQLTVPPGTIQGSAATGRQHRILTLTLQGSDREALLAIAQAAAAELQENAASYFQQLGTPGAGVTLLDGPTVSPVGPGVRRQIEFPLRVLLAAAVGLGLALFWDYWDPSVRSRRELEEMGLPVLGEIPKHR
ncbi:hypothetical protein FKZ61_013275 [Litorilinea aerophila]|uniref:Polysaccharide chain length determinant N-terminal domain-containing protein n=1 Tax=Litorilinea aerophila TaxID=1204385 RepID=A0A540VEC3_9CHLR|nr:hypothetical protein [Litorilinea aerophila]MCC9077073.1 hypothetical protein [Litorilinea aerophila]OUC08873.1 hypothetical protein RY27_06375 [Litorilinea aerophila]GIV76183.1 MAG: hypothetical protein KatS3mg050_0577 [Litorilinea sp.]